MNAPTAFPDQKPVPPYKHTPLFPLGADTTPYKKITAEGVKVEKVLGRDMLVVSREALRALSEAAFGDINHYLRPGHLQQLRSILDAKSDTSLVEIRAELHRYGVAVSATSTIGRFLRRAGLTRKKSRSGPPNRTGPT